MSRRGLIAFAVVTFIMTCSGLAQEAKVVDTKNVEVNLAKVTSRHIEVTLENSGAVLRMPVENLSRIVAVGDGKTLVFTTIDGREVRGTTSDSLEGEWELGEYAVRLSRVKSVVFHAQAAKAATMPIADQPDGFVLTCTDSAGMAIEIYSASFNFTYSYPAAGNWIPYPPTRRSENNPRQFLPMEIDYVTVSIPFARIESVELRPPTSKSYGAMPTARVTTTDGKVVNGQVAAYGEGNWRLTGKTAFGDFRLEIAKVARVEFQHGKDKNPTTEYLDRDIPGGQKLESGFTVRATTWGGREHVFTDACVFNLGDGHRWGYQSTSLNLAIGESQNTVEFNKIKALTFNTEGKFQGSLTTPTGTTVAVGSLSNVSHIGGKTQESGPGYLALKHVKIIEIVKKN